MRYSGRMTAWWQQKLEQYPFQPHPFPGDKLHEECGVFGIAGHVDAAAHTVLGLHALQHRGQEAAGIVSLERAKDGQEAKFHHHFAYGKVGDNFGAESVVSQLKGGSAIGHNRYSTSGGDKQIQNVQPLFAELKYGHVALAHNGNLTNAETLKKALVAQGCIFRTTMDSEVMVHLLAISKEQETEKALIDALKQVEGGYSLVVLDKETLYGVRDPYGVRPLVLGKLDGAFILTSESCALDIIGADYMRDIEPGEMVTIRGQELRSSHPFEEKPSKFCVFEYVYFSRPDSFFSEKDVYETRKNMGRILAEENPVDVDIIVPIPDSGVPAALGYSEASGVAMELGIIRNHYVGRTFIEPTDQIRHLGVKLKHNANRSVIEGQRVLLVDDSIVRGTTSKKIVAMIRAAGAKEVHMRISCPPTTHSCFYGVDTPSRDKLLAAKMSVKEIEQMIGVDSLAYLSINGMYRAVGEMKGRNNDQPQYCDACFTGEYPIPLTDASLRAGLEDAPQTNAGAHTSNAA